MRSASLKGPSPRALRMVDVGLKQVTRREAVAFGRILMSDEALKALREGRLPKGDALAAARVAGILAAKQTSAMIPLCHPLPIDSAEVELAFVPGGVSVRSRVRTSAKTGAEMEALVAVSLACLTLYDMTKSLDPAMTVGPIYLEEKRGGASGTWRRPRRSRRRPRGVAAVRAS